jgi:hypothetical protein
MADQQYDLFFSGQLMDGFYEDFVKADIKALFKANDAYIDKLFSGQEQLIKRQVDKATAIKFQQAFKKAGAKLIVKVHAPQIAQSSGNPLLDEQTKSASQPAPATMTPVSAGTVPAPAPAAPHTGSLHFQLTDNAVSGENNDELIEHHQPDIHAPDAVPTWGLAEAGSQLAEPSQIEPANVDTSALSVAEAGAVLTQATGFEAPAPVINTDAISLAEAGGDIETLDDKPPPVQVDTSHLRVEP